MAGQVWIGGGGEDGLGRTGIMDAEVDSRVDQVDVLDEDAVSGVVGERGGVGGWRCLV